VAGLDVSTPADNRVALNASEQGTVLLKNDHGVLPLSQQTTSIAVIGDAAGADAMYGAGDRPRSTPPTRLPRWPGSPAGPRPAAPP